MTLALPEAAPWPPPELAGLDDHPFNLHAHFPPIPADQNAAPLYLEALAEFDPGMAICFPESQRDEVRRRAVRRHERFVSIIDPSIGRAVPGMQGEIVDDVLAEYDVGFEKLERAQERPICAFEIGHTALAIVPHLAGMRQVLNVVRVRSDRDLIQGRFDRPVHSLAMILRLAADLKPRGSLICQVVAIAIERQAVELALDILRRPDVRTEHVDRTIGVLLDRERTAIPDPLAEGHRIEYVYERVALIRWERHEGVRSEKPIAFGEETVTFGETVVRAAQLDFGPHAPSTRVPLTNTAADFNAMLDAMTAEDFRREAGHIIDWYRQVIAVAQRPYREQLANDPEPAGFFLTLPGLRIKYAEVFARPVAALRMVCCMGATRRWMLETGQSPPDLEIAVRAAGMEAVPTDPFGEGPIGMTLVASQPVMYSVGPNGTNDGSVPAADTLYLNPILPDHSAATPNPQQYVPVQTPGPARPWIFKGSLRLFRIAGVDVDVHWSWALVAFIQIANRTTMFSSIVWDVFAYVGVFAIVLLHEFGHVFACRSVGGTANRVVLCPLGGLALMAPPPRPGALFWTVAAGPVVNLVLAPVLFGLVWLAAHKHDSIPYDLYLLAFALHVANLAMLILNLLPVYPLDGGRLLLAALWWPFGLVRALMVSAALGLVAGAALLVLSVFLRDFWFGVTAAFLCFGAVAGLRWARMIAPMYYAAKRGGFACPACRIPPPVGRFWKCFNCGTTTDIFDPLQSCPKCASFFIVIPCTNCGQIHAGSGWDSSSSATSHRSS